LGALLEDYPQLVEGRYVVIASIDSGSYVPSEADRTRGWRSVGTLAFSPKVQTWRDLPTDMYDEWYVFDDAIVVDAIDASVNFQGFSPIDYEWTEKLDRFWEQVLKLRPLHVLGDGEFLYFVTRDANLFSEII